MPDIRGMINNIYSLEQLAEQDSLIHRVHPLAKMVSAFVYIVCLVSFDRYAFLAMLPYLLYPLLFIYFAHLPFGMICKRTLLALPFCLFIGLGNLIMENTLAYQLGSLHITYGELSFVTIILKTFLCVSTVLILIATTPFTELTKQLRLIHVPDILISLLEMTYRYIGVLAQEVYSMTVAYNLRSFGSGSLAIKHMGSFAGQLLLRSFDRAERIYQAMQCRGYSNMVFKCTPKTFGVKDIWFLFSVCTLAITLRFLMFERFLGCLK